MRLDNTRTPKQLFYGEIAVGKRRIGRPKLRFKDVLKYSLGKVSIPSNNFEALANDRLSGEDLSEKA